MSIEADKANSLALHGGKPVRAKAPEREDRWGLAEEERLREMVGQSSLFYWKNRQTEAMLEAFRKPYPFKHVMPCGSCSAALHIGVAAAGIGPGDEVITSSVTDMGTVIGVLFQQAVPVFADIDPDTFNLDPRDVEKKITSRTRAIIVVHFSGNPCEMDAFLEIGRKHDLLIIEDCAQAWGATYRGRPVGTMGDLGCYSFDDFKLLSCGDGGLVASNRDDIGARLQPFGDKGYDRSGGPRNPTILAANYRMSEPQAAVAAGQLERLEEMAAGRAWMGDHLDARLEGIPGVQTPERDKRDRHTFWFYTIKLDLDQLSCDRDTFVKALNAEGVLANDGSFPSTTYQWQVFQEHAFFNGRWPLKEAGGTEMDYSRVSCPAAEAVIRRWFRLILFEGMDASYLDDAAVAIRKVAAHFRLS
ncbi:MAG: DegT/DnrJ/EryC1/StrS family aminotransferase [Oceanipulchritudo sp.]